MSSADDVYMAKLAEQAERYDEMVEYMKKVAQAASNDLSLEERNLLSVAYKNVVGARRASLRIIGSIKSKEMEKGGDKTALVTTYEAKVLDELNKICTDILELLSSTLIEKAGGSAEASVCALLTVRRACAIASRKLAPSAPWVRPSGCPSGRSPARATAELKSKGLSLRSMVRTVGRPLGRHGRN